MSSKQTLGERITRARLALGASRGRFVSKADLGEMVGLTGATVGNYEAGRTEPPYAILAALAKALGVDAGWLAFGDAEAERIYIKPAATKTPKELEKPRASRRKGTG